MYTTVRSLGENLFAWPIPVLPEGSLAKACPDIRGRDVAVYWYKTMRNYYFYKDKEILHAHAGKRNQRDASNKSRNGSQV